MPIDTTDPKRRKQLKRATKAQENYNRGWVEAARKYSEQENRARAGSAKGHKWRRDANPPAGDIKGLKGKKGTQSGKGVVQKSKPGVWV